MSEKFIWWATFIHDYFDYGHLTANDGIFGLSGIIALIGKGVKNSSDEQHLSMTSCIIAILRQIITSWVIAMLQQTMELAVFPASFSKVENGFNRNQVFP